jgi:cytochrome c1
VVICQHHLLLYSEDCQQQHHQKLQYFLEVVLVDVLFEVSGDVLVVVVDVLKMD